MFSFANTTDPWDNSSYQVTTNNNDSRDIDDSSVVSDANPIMGNLSSVHSDSSSNSISRSSSSSISESVAMERDGDPDISDLFRISDGGMVVDHNLRDTHNELVSIQDFIATAQRSLNEIGLGPSGGASTPRLNSGARTPLADISIEPSDDASPPRVISGQRHPLVDISFDVAPRVVSGRFPARSAVIDLCTPEAPRRVEGFINLEDSYEPPVRINRRGVRRNAPDDDLMNNDAADFIDLTPSPPKRSCFTSINNDTNDKSTDDAYKCPVCLDSVRHREPCTTRCGHIFCKSCIESAVRSTRKCPLCNKRITVRQLMRIYL